MKIQLASDLHLEFLTRGWPGERLIQPHPDAEVLVLAGDIANGDAAMFLFEDWPVPVIYVCGNHELYGHPIEGELEKMKKSCVEEMHFLENETVSFGDVRFIGATLWTDYLLNQELTQEAQMAYAHRSINDHRLIRNGRALFTPEHALARHETSKLWLIEELAKPWTGKTVVVTHHGPHPRSTHSRFANSPLNAAFISDLSDVLLSDSAPDLWLHGHVHDSFDYVVGTCRVVANPAGYIKNRHLGTSREKFSFENGEFQASMILEV